MSEKKVERGEDSVRRVVDGDRRRSRESSSCEVRSYLAVKGSREARCERISFNPQYLCSEVMKRKIQRTKSELEEEPLQQEAAKIVDSH